MNRIGTDVPLVIEAPLAGAVMLMQAAWTGAEHASTTISVMRSRKSPTVAARDDTDAPKPAKTLKTNFSVDSRCGNICGSLLWEGPTSRR
jgi:hypothetical protein